MATKKKSSKKRSDFATKAQYDRYKKRSAAARKGWKTKIRNRIEATHQFRPSNPRITDIPENLTVEELRWRLLEAQSLLAMEVLTRGFVDALEVEKLHKNMTIAVMPSRLRHMGALTDVMEKELKKANRKGEVALKKKAREYAEWFDVPLREVYTLFISP